MPEHDPEAPPREGDRIAKLLARAGIASRREVERMIADGRVAIGGRTVDTPATLLTTLGGVTVDGKPVARPEPTRLVRFHKPGGLITAERDPGGRPTIYTALRNALPAGTPRLMPVGRLDLNTEGLLLLTNDGGLKRALELPASGVPRTYRARTFGDVSQAMLEELMDGIEIEGVRYGPINANLERSTGRNQWIELTLAEGKNREVRRVLEHLGLAVSRLLRTAYGPFALGDLPRGQAQEVRQVDVERLRKSLRMAPETVGEAAPIELSGTDGSAHETGGAARRRRRPPPRHAAAQDRDGDPHAAKSRDGRTGETALRGGGSRERGRHGAVPGRPGARSAAPGGSGTDDAGGHGAGPGRRGPRGSGQAHAGRRDAEPGGSGGRGSDPANSDTRRPPSGKGRGSRDGGGKAGPRRSDTGKSGPHRAGPGNTGPRGRGGDGSRPGGRGSGPGRKGPR